MENDLFISLHYWNPFRHPKYFSFVENYKNYGFVQGIRLTLKDDVRKQEVCNVVNLWRLIYKIPRKLYQKINNTHGK